MFWPHGNFDAVAQVCPKPLAITRFAKQSPSPIYTQTSPINVGPEDYQLILSMQRWPRSRGELG